MIGRRSQVAVPKTNQRVEKVYVGPVGGPKGARNKVKTLRKRRFQPLVQTLKRARRCFSTRWFVFDTVINADIHRTAGTRCWRVFGGQRAMAYMRDRPHVVAPRYGADHSEGIA